VKDETKTRLKVAAALLGAAALVVLSVIGAPGRAHKLAGGDQMILNGGGMKRVVTNSSGLLAGSGTVSNPLTATISQGSGLAGTGSSGDALTTDVTASFNYVSGKLAMPNDYLATHLEWNDEMLYQNATVNAPLGAFLFLNTSGAVTINELAAAGRPGVFELASAVATTGRFALQTSDTMVDFNSASWDSEMTFGVPTLSTGTDEYTLIAGFIDNGGSRNQTDGCYVAYDRGNAMTNGTNTTNLDKFSCWCAQNTTRTTFLMDGSTVSNESFTTVDSPVAALTLPNTNIYTVRVKMTGTTRAEFFINGTKRCDINTNIPNSATRATGFGVAFLRGAATAARSLDVDRLKVITDLNSVRSP